MLATWVLMGCLISFLTGCEDTLTGQLWERDGALNHSGPAPYPDLKIYQTANHKDFVVQYDEVDEGNAIIKRRAYLLDANEGRVESGRRPHFIRIANLKRLEAIPVETNSAPDAKTTNSAGLRAVMVDYRHFVVLSNGDEIRSSFLPAYINRRDQAWRIALTPVAVTGDVVIVCAVTAAVLGMIYLASQSGTNSWGNN
jgi:hypothetical protein